MKIESLNLFTSFATFNSSSLIDQIILKRPKLPKSIETPPVNSEQALEVVDGAEAGGSGCGLPPFTPYPSVTPWHTGSRGFLSRLFPRYGNYCGPNWSSGRENGSLVWDKGPIDALDFCCYKHDIGYDSVDQADLHRADLVMLNCLKRIPQEGRKPGNSPLSEPYRQLYIFGLTTVLIPYRKFLLQKVDEKTRKRLAMGEINLQNGRERGHMS